MEIAVTGSHGLIGTALVRSLQADGHRVRALVRSQPRPGSEDIRWDPEGGELDPGALEGIHAVVHLAGAGIASAPWTGDQRRRILDSRVDSTTLLARRLAELDAKPAVLVSGSAIGIYGSHRGDERLTETSAPGDDFLADVCCRWEAAAAPAAGVGIQVAHLRTGVVLSAEGGALAKQLVPFKLGLGGRAGDGRQWFSWVSLDDEVSAIRFLIDHEVAGPVNVTAPEPVTNSQFTKTLGRVLHRPAVLSIPRVVTRLPFGVGDLADSLLFASQRVEPAVLARHGYSFADTDLEPTLRRLLAR